MARAAPHPSTLVGHLMIGEEQIECLRAACWPARGMGVMIRRHQPFAAVGAAGAAGQARTHPTARTGKHLPHW